MWNVLDERSGEISKLLQRNSVFDSLGDYESKPLRSLDSFCTGLFPVPLCCVVIQSRRILSTDWQMGLWVNFISVVTETQVLWYVCRGHRKAWMNQFHSFLESGDQTKVVRLVWQTPSLAELSCQPLGACTRWRLLHLRENLCLHVGFGNSELNKSPLFMKYQLLVLAVATET